MKDAVIIEARRMLCQYLAEVARKKGLSTYKVAELTGFKQPNVSRMFAGKYTPSLDNFMKLCEAVGVYFFIIDKEDEKSNLTEIMCNRWEKPGNN